MTTYDEVMRRFQKSRKSLNMTQNDLSKIFSVTQCQISKLEAGEYRLTFQNLKSLENHTEIRTDYLVTGMKEKNSVFRQMDERFELSRRARFWYLDLIASAFSLLSRQNPELVPYPEHFSINKFIRLARKCADTPPDTPQDCWLNLRNVYNLTQLQMSVIIDADFKHYRRLEKGQSFANAELLMNTYNKLCILPSYFLSGSLDDYCLFDRMYLALPQKYQELMIEYLAGALPGISRICQ